MQDVDGWRHPLSGANPTTVRATLATLLQQVAVPSAERARAVVGNTLRLHGKSAFAREMMSYSNLLPAGQGGDYVRALGLVCWEQAQMTEAAALLERAERLFRDEEGQPAEARATQRLRVLLHAELGDVDEVDGLDMTLQRGLQDGLPWLRARADFCVARCLTARSLGHHRESEDRKTAAEAFRRGLRLAAAVQDETERLYLDWLAARAWARRKGGRALGAQKLERLVERAIRLWPPGDVALLLFDLFVCRTPSRSDLGLVAFEAELRRILPAPGGESTATKAVAVLKSLTQPLTAAWDQADRAARHLRSIFRLLHPPGLRPIPFVVPWPGADAVPGSRET